MTYEMRECVVEGVPPPNSHMAAYAPDGGYIGLQDFADMLEERGIQPQRRTPEMPVCSIGFCEREQKWYGWSHRAMCGFGIGSSVTKGDCAYQPTDEADFAADRLRFWGDNEYHSKAWTEIGEDDGERGVYVRWTYKDTVPNETLRGTEGDTFCPFPKQFGRGEWTAQTLDDAKQMASDFAEGVD